MVLFCGIFETTDRMKVYKSNMNTSVKTTEIIDWLSYFQKQTFDINQTL